MPFAFNISMQMSQGIVAFIVGFSSIDLDGEFHMDVGDEMLLFLLHPDGAVQYLRPGFDHRFVIYG